MPDSKLTLFLLFTGVQDFLSVSSSTYFLITTRESFDLERPTLELWVPLAGVFLLRYRLDDELHRALQEISSSGLGLIAKF